MAAQFFQCLSVRPLIKRLLLLMGTSFTLNFLLGYTCTRYAFISIYDTHDPLRNCTFYFYFFVLCIILFYGLIKIALRNEILTRTFIQLSNQQKYILLWHNRVHCVALFGLFFFIILQKQWEIKGAIIFF